jgi:hypothetical protein
MYERMEQELTNQDECEEVLWLEYNLLERKYCKYKKQKTLIVIRKTNTLSK